jgi:hypothetical protein
MHKEITYAPQAHEDFPCISFSAHIFHACPMLMMINGAFLPFLLLSHAHLTHSTLIAQDYNVPPPGNDDDDTFHVF